MNIEDTKELREYLENQGIIPAGNDLDVVKLTGGISNRTIKVGFNGNAWVMKQALPKLRVQGNWFSEPERIYYEAEAIRWFEHHLPGTCPVLVFEDKEQFILAMEAVAEPFRNLKEILMDPVPPVVYFSKAGRLLGKIHSIGLHRKSIPEIFFNTQFFESLRIEPYYQECMEQVPETKDFFNNLVRDTRLDRYSFTHGDYSPKNMLVKNHQLILLDHEVAHFGDGTFDLGFFIAHLLSKANYNSKYRHTFLQGIIDFLNAYLESPVELHKRREQRAVKHSIGCLLARVCGLSQLDYLNPGQKTIQKAVGLKLIECSPLTISEMVSSFKELLARETGKNQ